jgi:hypothetical protein
VISGDAAGELFVKRRLAVRLVLGKSLVGDTEPGSLVSVNSG